MKSGLPFLHSIITFISESRRFLPIVPTVIHSFRAGHPITQDAFLHFVQCSSSVPRQCSRRYSCCPGRGWVATQCWLPRYKISGIGRSRTIADHFSVDTAIARNCTGISPCQQDTTIIRDAEISANIVNECGRTELTGNIDVGENTENALAAGAVTKVKAGTLMTVTIHQVSRYLHLSYSSCVHANIIRSMLTELDHTHVISIRPVSTTKKSQVPNSDRSHRQRRYHLTKLDCNQQCARRQRFFSRQNRRL